MRSIAILYEDRYAQKFDGLLRALRRSRGMSGVILANPPWSAKGTGGFARELRARIHLPSPRGAAPPAPVDRVVCVADADRPDNLVPGFRSPPAVGQGDALDAWVRELETCWKERLIKDASLSQEEASRVEVLCLRWSKESLLIAGTDMLLGRCDPSLRRGVESSLEACRPVDPRTVLGEEFTDVYRNPQRCVEDVFKTGKAPPFNRYKKGRDDEDLLDEMMRTTPCFDPLLKRCPDLRVLLDLLQ